MPPVMLRRMKQEGHIEGLPEVSVQRYEREMPAAQAAEYDRIVVEARSSKGEKGSMLKALQGLRRTSLSPRLGVDDDDEGLAAGSARILACLDILDGVRDKRQKALVFIEDLEMQGLLMGLFQRRFGLDSPPLLINGKVPGAKRQALVNEFQGRKGFDVMLLSPRAGGVGLTLTAANHVVHLSRWWNPAVEDQCSDRVYRIGQSRDVTIHLPIAIHPDYGAQSFDCRLDDLLERKRHLSRTVLAPVTTSARDYDELFSAVVGD